MKSRAFKKLILAGSTAFLLAGSLTMSTWAWFKINSSARVETTNFKVTGGTGFLVSVDGSSYSDSLSKDQILKALLISYSNGQYVMDGDGDDETIYERFVDTTEVDGEKVSTVRYEKLSKETVDALIHGGHDEEGNYIQDILSKISLLPVTTSDCVSMRELSGSRVYASSGRFIEFDAFFRTTSTSAREVYNNSTQDYDPFKYDVYLNGSYEGPDYKLIGTEYKDVTSDVITNTVFTSPVNKVNLATDMKAVITNVADDGTVTKSYETISRGNTVKVYTTNAARISTQSKTLVKTSDVSLDADKTYYVYKTTYNEALDTNDKVLKPVLEPKVDDLDYYYEYIDLKPTKDTELVGDKVYYQYSVNRLATTPNEIVWSKVVNPQVEMISTYYESESDAVIYEINDTENGVYDLGSYATVFEDEDPQDEETLFKFDYAHNAMVYYYNHLKSKNNLTPSKMMKYSDLPTNIVSKLPAKHAKDLTEAATAREANESSYYPMARLLSGDEAKKVTIRVWLEGWDADCFDGLTNAITCRLTFCSVNKN